MVELIINGSKIMVDIAEAKRIYAQLQRLLVEDNSNTNTGKHYYD